MFHNQLVTFTTAFFNKLLEQESYPELWSSGSIIPIHKKGDRKIPSNYRGITLLPVMGKLYTSILRDRLEYWAELNDHLCESQFGFRQGRRTTDTIFVITTASQSYKKKNKSLFSTSQRHLIPSTTSYFGRNYIASMGMSSKLLSILQAMYANATSRVLYSKQLIFLRFSMHEGSKTRL